METLAALFFQALLSGLCHFFARLGEGWCDRVDFYALVVSLDPFSPFPFSRFLSISGQRRFFLFPQIADPGPLRPRPLLPPLLFHLLEDEVREADTLSSFEFKRHPFLPPASPFFFWLELKAFRAPLEQPTEILLICHFLFLSIPLDSQGMLLSSLSWLHSHSP